MADRVITISADALQAASVKKQGRVNRYPQHDFYLETKPWAIQPFMIAPVLPGETLKNGLLQSRCVTDPIKAPLIGWHHEYYIFYVKLSDLDEREAIFNMLLDNAPLPDFDHAGPGDANADKRDKAMFMASPGFNWTRKCLNRVVSEYFRNEGDNPALIFSNGADGPGLPPATFQTREYWHDSVKLESSVPAGDEGVLYEEDAWMDANIPPEFADHWTQFQRMRALKLTEVTFEDWLRQFGVTPPKAQREDLRKPELLRYIRDWSYPANTVDPSTGIPNSVVSWSIAERLDKDRFFKEPGFIFGVTVTRPKVYLGRQRQAATEMLRTALSWLPAVMNNDPYTSLVKFAKDKGPLGHSDTAVQPAEAYWVDARDLFLYGDQFTNIWMDQSDQINTILRPAANMERRYPTDAESNALFSGARNLVRIDGVFQMTIAGQQVNHT